MFICILTLTRHIVYILPHDIIHYMVKVQDIMLTYPLEFNYGYVGDPSCSFPVQWNLSIIIYTHQYYEDTLLITTLHLVPAILSEIRTPL